MKFHKDIYAMAAPVVGVVTGSQRVESKRFHMGFRVMVKRPNGSTEVLRASDFDKQVRACIAKDVNLFRPDVKAGDVREIDVKGYAWIGTVEQVKQETIIVRPKALTLPSGEVFTDGEPQIFTHVGNVTRESLFMYDFEVGNARTEYQSAVSGAKLGDPIFDSAGEKYRETVAALRAKYPDVTDMEARDIY